MTMSVGLGRIGNDPQATVLTRKALGILSTPGLLVYDDALTIDETGRIVLRLAPNSGMFIDETGLGVSPVAEKIGIDSEVDPRSEAYDRQWNARLTGPAPNYFESSLAIGSEELAGQSAGITATGGFVEPAKVNITSITTQLRLSYDPENFAAFRVLESGFCELFSVGVDDPGFHLITGDGTLAGVSGGLRLNYGTTILRVLSFQMTGGYGGGGVLGTTSWFEETFSVSDPSGSITAGNTIVSVIPTSSSLPPAEYLSWSVRISATNQVAVRVAFIDVLGAHSTAWTILIHQML